MKSMKSQLDTLATILFWITPFVALALILTQPYETTDLLFKQVFSYGLIFFAVLITGLYLYKSELIVNIGFLGVVFYGTIFFGSIFILGGSNFLGFDFASPKKYVLMVNCQDEPLNISFDNKNYLLESREVLIRRRNDEKISITHPGKNIVESVAFVEGINVVAYGEKYKVKVRDILGPRKYKLFNTTPGYEYVEMEGAPNAISHFPYEDKLEAKFFLPSKAVPEKVVINRRSRFNKSKNKFFKIICD